MTEPKLLDRVRSRMRLDRYGLHTKDVDFDNKQIVVRDGKGMKDRVTVLPNALILPLKQLISA